MKSLIDYRNKNIILDGRKVSVIYDTDGGCWSCVFRKDPTCYRKLHKAGFESCGHTFNTLPDFNLSFQKPITLESSLDTPEDLEVRAILL